MNLSKIIFFWGNVRSVNEMGLKNPGKMGESVEPSAISYRLSAISLQKKLLFKINRLKEYKASKRHINQS